MERRCEGSEIGFDFELVQDAMARALLKSKYAMLILLVLHRKSVESTSNLTHAVGGSPAIIIDTLKMLEKFGLIERPRSSRGRHAHQNRLTVLGRHLIEAPVPTWPSLLSR